MDIAFVSTALVSTALVSDDTVRDIRSQLAAAGAEMRPATDVTTIRRVLDRVGDPGLVIDAILMNPRPAWLRDLIGLDLLGRDTRHQPTTELDIAP